MIQTKNHRIHPVRTGLPCLRTGRIHSAHYQAHHIKTEPTNTLAFGRIPAYCKYELFMERYRSAAEIIRREIRIGPDTRILDVGCGNGYMKHFFDEGEGEWHGIEVWEQRVRCCQKLGYQIAEINIETTPFPYPDESFAVVFASHVIEHLPDPAQALRECARVLQPGGLLLVATPTKTSARGRSHECAASSEK